MSTKVNHTLLLGMLRSVTAMEISMDAHQKKKKERKNNERN
jgi:hypothetical protein